MQQKWEEGRRSNFLGLRNYIFNFLVDTDAFVARYAAYLYLLTIRRMWKFMFVPSSWMFTENGKIYAFRSFGNS